MFRATLCFLTAALLMPAASSAQKKSALDKATLEAYVRHYYVFSPEVKVQVLDPKPADLPGFLEVVVRASNGTASQDFPLYVSKDGQKIVQGTAFDVNANPFKHDLDLLKTELQPSFGTPGAPVVLVEFSDFECSYCREEATVLRKNLLTAYPTQVRLYFKDFPLETMHPWAKAALVAGRCVFRQAPAAFWDYHDWIFQSQADITPENLKDKVQAWAKDKEVDALQLNRCMETGATSAEVEKNQAEGRALNVNSTPTLFVNGRRLVGNVEWETLRTIIDFELEYQKTAKNAGEDCGCELKLDTPGIQKPPAPGTLLKKK